MKLSVDRIQSIWEYKDGKLFWKIKPSRTVNIGDEAGCVDQEGYRKIRYKGVGYRRNRLVYYMHTGEYPKLIDHIDQDRLNDKIENLREASHCLNSQNSNKIRGLIPYRGVYYHKNNKTYDARLQFRGIRYNLGSFHSAEEAVEAYQKFKQICTASLV